MAIEAIAKKISDSEVKLPLDNPVVADALRRGDIQGLHKLLTEYGLSIGDFEQFAANQHEQFFNKIIQHPLYEIYASTPPPKMEDFPQFDMSNSFSQDDKKMATEMIVGKAMKASGKAATKGAVGGKASKPDLSEMQEHHDDAMDELDNLNNVIMDAQFTQDLQNKSAELEREYERIVLFCKSHPDADTAILILALAKVQAEKYGLVFTQLGKKVQNVNDQMNGAYELLKNDPSIKQQYTAKQDLQTGNRDLGKLMNDMKLVADHVHSAITSAKSSIDMIKAGKDDIIRKLSASGG